MQKSRLKLVIAASAALIAEMFAPVLTGIAQAAPPPQFAAAYIRLDRQKAVTATGGTVCVKTNTLTETPLLGTENDVQVTFPTQVGTDFVVNATAANWTVTTTNLPAGSSAWPGVGTATSVSGHTVTFPSTVLSASTLYCFNFAGVSTLTTGSFGDALVGVIHTRDAAGTPLIIDETNYAFSIITDDQIVVSAVVPPNFIFSLSGFVDGFTANLSTATVISTTGVTFDVVTNAKAGWIAWAKDSQQGLYSATANYKINTTGSVNAAPSTLSNGVEGYVLDADFVIDSAGGCTLAVDAEYDGPTTADGGTLSANFQPVAACTGVPPATANHDQVKLIERAAIAGGTPAGSDYTDVITVVAAGNF